MAAGLLYKSVHVNISSCQSQPKNIISMCSYDLYAPWPKLLAAYDYVSKE